MNKLRILITAICYVLVLSSVSAQTPVKSAEERAAKNYVKEFLAAIDGTPSKQKLKVYEYTEHIIYLSDYSNDIFLMMVRDPWKHLVSERILAFSVGSPQATLHKNSTMRHILLHYENLLRSMAEGTLPKEESIVDSFEYVPPILSHLRWRQFGLHNVFPNQGRSVRYGCGAVAIGQLMKHYQWPDTIRHDFSYTDRKKQNRSLKMDGTPIDWHRLKNEYKYHDKDSISLDTLMRCISIAIQSDFGEGTTFSYTNHFKRALTTHFGYSTDISHVTRRQVSEESMQNLIRNELQNSRPTILCGGSHIFLCDGMYKSFLHLNMGWNGEFDGWYRFPIVTKGINPQAFIESALLNIIPTNKKVPQKY